MSAQGVAVLLSWLSCCGSAVWRYSTNSPNYHIFSTRSTIKLEYEGTLFSEWSVPATCSVKNKSSPKTELRCSSPGVQTIRPIVTGPDSEEERNLSVDSSHICFLWYYKVINFFHNLTQVVVIWIYDPENADPSELLWNANEPSLNSIILTKQLATLGQKPGIYTTLRRRIYLPYDKMKNGCFQNLLFLFGFQHFYYVIRCDFLAKRRSSMAIWTENEVYLGYTFLKFVKIITTEKLKNLLNISSAATLTIHNVEYPGHPLELALLLNYCTACNINKTIYVVIYNEDTEQWVYQDFALDVSTDSFLTPHFIYAALPDLILRDKHRIYYCYHNFTETGVLQTPTEFGNLSRLSHNSIIHDIFIDYYGNVVVKMENNIMFYFKINIRAAIKLHLWTNSTMKSLILLSSSAQIYLIYVFENGTVQPREYPLKLESQSVHFTTKEKCPYMAFHNNILSVFYFLDKGQNLSIWAQIVYPENVGLYIVVESYGPNILQEKEQVHYEIALGYCTKTTTVTFFQNINYEAVDDYFKLQDQNTGLRLVQVRPSEYARACPIAQKVFQIAVGCDSTKYIAVKGFNKKDCLQHDFFYVIEKSYLRNQPSKNLRVKYNWKKYGCPLRLDFGEKFHPLVQLYNDNGYVEDVEVNFIVWEIHGRKDYSFNNTMKKSGCLNEAQTWKSMTKLNQHLPLEEAWGPENYKHCFSYAIGKPGDLNQPYEIINKSNYNHLIWPEDHSGMYVFRVKILDPNYSFCNLTAIFAIETFGMIPSPSGYLVAAFLFVLMLLFFSILVLSYFHYMRIYKQYLYEPINRYDRKQKNN
ncbi:cation channel sperm-associated protein subunit epsilon [Mirounga leonina]|uniref:cation channel sperm-associated protein subunit epsilon n=1 Tax=Mirounga leonina TaxID=9715 RepID=UPI00156C15E0|nr:cation channel sperm-associated protein subunit epsilon [Mirounga leonina]